MPCFFPSFFPCFDGNDDDEEFCSDGREQDEKREEKPMMPPSVEVFPSGEQGNGGSNVRNSFDSKKELVNDFKEPVNVLQRAKLADPKREELVKKKSSGSEFSARIFSFRELAAATKNFRQECLLGEGGFGTVHKGHLETGEIVDSIVSHGSFLIDYLIEHLKDTVMPNREAKINSNSKMFITTGKVATKYGEKIGHRGLATHMAWRSDRAAPTFSGDSTISGKKPGNRRNGTTLDHEKLFGSQLRKVLWNNRYAKQSVTTEIYMALLISLGIGCRRSRRVVAVVNREE